MSSNKNKILFVLGTYNHGGTESQFLKLIEALKKNTNIEADVFFLNKVGDIGLRSRLEKLNINIYGTTYNFILDQSGKKGLIFKLKKYLKNINILRELILLIIKKKYTKIQAFLPEANFFATLSSLVTFKDVYTGWRGLPSNMKTHTHKLIYFVVNSFSNLVSKKIIANANMIIEEKKYLEKFVKPEKIEVINNIFYSSGISAEAKDFSENFFSEKKLNEKVNIITIANIKEYKGHIYAIDAIKELPDDYNYIMIGDDLDGYYSNLKEKITNLNLQDRVFYLGPLSNDFSMAILSKSQIYLSTSKTEGLSNSILEALMYEKKIVASDVGGTKELLSNGKYGYLFELGDAKKLKDLLIKANKEKNLIKGNIDEFKNKFSSENVLNEYLRVWNF